MFLVASFLCFGQDVETYDVTHVVDGDTLKLANGQTLKLAGINAPDIHETTTLTQQASKLGKEVWSYRTAGVNGQKAVAQFLKASDNKIELEAETQSFDDEGNLFAYVFVSIPQTQNLDPDGTIVIKSNNQYKIFLNAYLVSMGFAEMVSPDAKYKDLFEGLEQKAKAEKKGIWA